MPWKLVTTLALLVAGVVAVVLSRRRSPSLLEYEVYPSIPGEGRGDGDISAQPPDYSGDERLAATESFEHYSAQPN